MSSNGKKAKIVKRVDAGCSPSKPQDFDKDILRWPVYLPSGHQREIQIKDICPTNPMYGYSSVPRAGTIYGLDVTHKRIEYMHTVVKNYVPFIKALLACEKPLLWHSTIFPNDENGFKLLEFEYKNLGNFYEYNTEVEESMQMNTSVVQLLPTRSLEKFTASQLIFGLHEDNHTWVHENLNLDTGRLDGVSNYTNSYFTWIGIGPNNLYREYRFNERWSFIPYAYEYHTVEDDMKSGKEFFQFVLNTSVYKDEWELVRKSFGKFNCNIFAICNICPRKYMELFEEYNFVNKKKWHRYNQLLKLYNVPNQMKSIIVPFFEDDLEPSFHAAVKELRARKVDVGAAVKQFSKYTPRVTMQDLSTLVLNNYYNILAICNKKRYNIKNPKHVGHIPEFIEYSSGLQILSIGDANTPTLHSEQACDYYAILCKIDLVASSLEIRGQHVSDKLNAIFNEANLMRERFISAVNMFNYRNGIHDLSNRAMLAKVILACFDHKTELNVFEKRTVRMVNSTVIKSGSHVIIRSFQEKIRLIVESPKSDVTLSIRDLAKVMLRNSRNLTLMFRKVKTTTLAMGHDQLTFVNVD